MNEFVEGPIDHNLAQAKARSQSYAHRQVLNRSRVAQTIMDQRLGKL